MAGQWEVVGKKKNKNDGSKKNKNQPKTHVPKSVPKVEEKGPIQGSQTIFDIFIEKEKKAQVNKLNGITASIKPKTNSVSQKKKSQDKKKNQPVIKNLSLEDGIKSLNFEEMKNCFAQVEARFPENPQIWLQDLASYLNIKLDIEIPDPLFNNKPLGYPCCLFSSETYEFLISALERCSIQILQFFFEHCMTSMIQDTVKGLNTTGYRIFLQCLSQEMPHITLENISKIIDYRNSYQNRQNVCLSILWATGQAGNKSLEAGFKVWLEVFFPIIGSRVYSKHIVDYLETLTIGERSKAKIEKNILGVREIFPLLDVVYSSGLAANLQKQLQALYPKIKSLSYGPNPAGVLRNYFPSYLRRLEIECPLNLRNELLSSLVECLTLDKHTYSIWRQLYTKHLAQSSFLIDHLHSKWETLSPQIPYKLLYETLSAFQVTNDELKGYCKPSQEHELQECVTACNALMNKMNTQRFPWGKLLFFLTVAVAAILAYDIQQNGSFKKSKTGELMKDVGLLAICEQAWSKINVYSKKAYRWIEINLPVYSKWLQDTFGPSVRLFWEKLFSLLVYVWNTTEAMRTWINATVPPVLQTINDNFPYYMKKLSSFIESFAVYFTNFVIQFSNFVEYYTSILMNWLHRNIFIGPLSPEKLQRFAGDTVQTFQQYTLTTYNWLSKSVATVIYPGR